MSLLYTVLVYLAAASTPSLSPGCGERLATEGEALRFELKLGRYDQIREFMASAPRRRRFDPGSIMRRALRGPSLEADLGELLKDFEETIWRFVDVPGRRTVAAPGQSRYVTHRSGQRGDLIYGQVLRWTETTSFHGPPRPALILTLLLKGDLARLGPADRARVEALRRGDVAPDQIWSRFRPALPRLEGE